MEQDITTAYCQMMGMDPTTPATVPVLETGHGMAVGDEDGAKLAAKLFGEATAAAMKEGRKALIVIIESGQSKNRNRYDPQVLQESVGLFKEAKVFYDHKMAGQRSFRDLAGEIVSARWHNGAIYGVFEALEADEWLRKTMKQKPHLVGFSVFLWVNGRRDEKTGENVITKILRVQSVDLVDDPAAGGRVVSLLEGVVPYRPTNGINTDASWSFSAKDGDAILQHGGWAAYKRAHAWFDDTKGDTPETKAAYKLPHHKLDGGMLKTYLSGVIAAAAAVAGARSPLQVPAKDLPGIKAHLRKHYAQADKTPPASLQEGADGTMSCQAFIEHHMAQGIALTAQVLRAWVSDTTEDGQAVGTVNEAWFTPTEDNATNTPTKEENDMEDKGKKKEQATQESTQATALEAKLAQAEHALLEAKVRHEAAIKAKAEELAAVAKERDELKAKVAKYEAKETIEAFLAEQKDLLDAVKEAVREEAAGLDKVDADVLKGLVEKWQGFAKKVTEAKAAPGAGIAPTDAEDKRADAQEQPEDKGQNDDGTAQYEAYLDSLFGCASPKAN